jgi:hypothetical protein
MGAAVIPHISFWIDDFYVLVPTHLPLEVCSRMDRIHESKASPRFHHRRHAGEDNIIIGRQ